VRSLEEDLRAQVQGQRWHGRASRWEKPGAASVQERAEAAILLLYLHVAEVRAELRRQLRLAEQDDFGLRHHRQIWATISELEEDNLGVERLEAINRGQDPGQDLEDLDLPRLLADRLVMEQSELLDRLIPLLEPGELQRLDFQNPRLHLRGAIAMRARLQAEKRCRHLLDAWRSQQLRTLEHCLGLMLERGAEPPAGLTPVVAMELRIEELFAQLNADALRFQQDYYSERRHLGELDRRRCADYAEVTAARNLPAA
jgi:DNA primase